MCVCQFKDTQRNFTHLQQQYRSVSPTDTGYWVQRGQHITSISLYYISLKMCIKLNHVHHNQMMYEEQSMENNVIFSVISEQHFGQRGVVVFDVVYR